MSALSPLSGKANYTKIKFLGEGAFGVVKQYKCKSTNELVAIKKIRLKQAKAGINLSAIRELKTLQELDHPHIIRIRDVFVHNCNIHLVLDCMVTELDMIIKDKRTVELTAPHIKAFLQQILEGVQYIHQNWILHRDLKPGNILIDERKCLKITDFGLARHFGSPDRGMSHQAVTRWYRSPELLFGAKNYGGAVDMWSVGCIFAEMILRVPYLQGETDIDQLSTIFTALGTPTEEDWPEMKYLPDYFTIDCTAQPSLKKVFPDTPDDTLGLLSSLMRFDPNKRLSANDALQHPYFSNAPSPTPQEFLPVPDPKKATDTGSLERHPSERYSAMFGMGPPRLNLVAESPVPLLRFGTTPDAVGRLHFPTPEGSSTDRHCSLDNSLDSSFEGKMPSCTPASTDTCGMPRMRPDRNLPPDSEERGKIRKRKLVPIRPSLKPDFITLQRL